MPGIPFPILAPHADPPTCCQKHPPLESSPCLEAPIATVAWGEARGPASHLQPVSRVTAHLSLGHHSP